MTPEQLKASILQMAIQGKLVEQRPEEGTAEELYDQIQEERKRVKIKELPVADIGEVPFDVPETWKWIHLQDVIKKTIKRGKSPKYAEQSTVLVFAQKCNVKTGGINMNLALFLDDASLEKYPTEEYMCGGDIVINSTGGGTMGRVGLFQDTDRINDMIIVPDGHVTVIRACDSVDYKYLYYFIKHNQKFLETQGEGSTNQTELKPQTIASLVLPLPPVNEQHRIVAKIEELLPYVDRYAEAYETLEQFNAKFPEDMKKSILQYAIQGKLVEQRPEEGTAEELYQQIQAEKQKLIKEGKIKKEKPLVEITEDEIPFDIPESWKWVRLRSLGSFSSGKTPNMGESKYWDNGTVSWITSKDMKKKYLSTSEMHITELAASEMKMYPKGTMLMVVRSGILKRLLPVAILTEKSTINQDIKALSLYNPKIVEYIYAVLKGLEPRILHEYRKQVTTVDSLRFEDFQDMPIPLPPLEEQQRIVAKIDELLPYCDRLVK